MDIKNVETKGKILLKDKYFNKTTIKMLTSCIEDNYQTFNQENFYNTIMQKLPELELKQRISLVCKCIKTYIELDYQETLEILYKALIAQEEGQFVFAAFSEYVEIYGCREEVLDISLSALGEFTKSFSAEFAIRAFINLFPVKTLEVMREWSLSDNVHQRRLACEGLRPKLPWAMKIDVNYSCSGEILDNLFSDNDRYVTRSVANHLNDISKIDPAFTMKKLQKWKKSGAQGIKEMDYIIHHSLRTLIKKGNIKALELLGYNNVPKIEVSDITLTKSDLNVFDYQGDTIGFEFEIRGLSKEQLMIDYIVEYPMSKGKRATKVFKIKKIVLDKNQRMTISKNHTFKKMTTKRLYTGKYHFTLQINGQLFSKVEFYVTIQ